VQPKVPIAWPKTSDSVSWESLATYDQASLLFGAHIHLKPSPLLGKSRRTQNSIKLRKIDIEHQIVEAF